MWFSFRFGLYLAKDLKHLFCVLELKLVLPDLLLAYLLGELPDDVDSASGIMDVVRSHHVIPPAFLLVLCERLRGVVVGLEVGLVSGAAHGVNSVPRHR